MSFHVNLNTTIYDLFKKQQSTDVKFICSNGEIGAHSIVLSANSTLFQNVNISVVAMMEYPKHAVLEFLTLLYKGSGDFNESSLKEMLNNFQCSYELNEIKEISNEEKNQSLNETKVKTDVKTEDKTEDPAIASGSVSVPNILLPNPYAKKTPGAQHKKRRKNKEKDPSSDDSDVCIIESPPPPVIEINDCLTEDLVLPPKNLKMEKYVDVTSGNLKIEPHSRKRKSDRSIDCIRTPVITSIQSGIETPRPESLAKKKKSDNRDASRRKHPEDKDSEMEKQERNLVTFDSTDEEEEPNTLRNFLNMQRKKESFVVFELEGSISKNTDLIARVMKFKHQDDMLNKMGNFCFECFSLMVTNHYREHQFNRWNKKEKCPGCPEKFGRKEMLQMHLRVCRGISK